MIYLNKAIAVPKTILAQWLRRLPANSGLFSVFTENGNKKDGEFVLPVSQCWVF
jgi:hypothetical protein